MPISKNAEQTVEIAKKIGQKVVNGGLICLYGDLGSGKTTFTKGLAQSLGYKDFSIKSPTFTYIRRLHPNFYHIDLYRLENGDQLLLQEIKEILIDSKNVVVIEWADKFDQQLKNFKKTKVFLKYKSKDERYLKIEND